MLVSRASKEGGKGTHRGGGRGRGHQALLGVWPASCKWDPEICAIWCRGEWPGAVARRMIGACGRWVGRRTDLHNTQDYAEGT
jgi:hypothetical protein